MKTVCIILNYNDETTTIKLAKKIMHYEVFDSIIIVDNCSNEECYKKLETLISNKVVLIRTNKNGGYGYGNNYGIRYAKENGARYALVCNPDVLFEEKTIKDCIRIMQEEKECAAIAPKMKGGNVWRIAPAITDICYSSLLLNKLIKPRYYPKTITTTWKDKEYEYIDAVPGSLVLFDIEKFEKAGLYDENVFLFHEEMIIACRLKKHGYTTIIYLHDYYIHDHGVTVSKNYKSIKSVFKIGRKSHKYYLSKYLNASIITILLFNLMAPFELIEQYIWRKISRQ